VNFLNNSCETLVFLGASYGFGLDRMGASIRVAMDNVRPVGSCPPAVSVTRFGPPATVHHHLIDKESHMEQCR
jgi:hypothetical protein